MGEIEPCEGYLAKLQKIASKGLESFIKELHEAIIQSEIVYWDDTVIQIVYLRPMKRKIKKD